MKPKARFDRISTKWVSGAKSCCRCNMALSKLNYKQKRLYVMWKYAVRCATTHLSLCFPVSWGQPVLSAYACAAERSLGYAQDHSSLRFQWFRGCPALSTYACAAERPQGPASVPSCLPRSSAWPVRRAKRDPPPPKAAAPAVGGTAEGGAPCGRRANES